MIISTCIPTILCVEIDTQLAHVSRTWMTLGWRMSRSLHINYQLQ